MSYERPEVERLLGEMLHGGTQWDKETTPDADMPTARPNPARGNSHAAMMVDCKRAFAALMREDAFKDPVALWFRFYGGLSSREVARYVGVSHTVVQRRWEYDVGLLRDAMEAGKR